MDIPKHFEIRIPALELLHKLSTPLKLNEFEAPLASVFGLSEDQIHQEYDSGNGKIFYDRISWALSYMNMSGLVDKPKRGQYQISQTGIEMLSTPDAIHDFIAEQIAKRRKTTPDQNNVLNINTEQDNLTPQEELYASANAIRESRYQELLETILIKTPREFEKLVVSLLQRMGYGGEIKDAGSVTSYTNDGGIDGIIKEDVLGLGRIHIQAKRYAPENTVSRDDIQKFVGALAVARSNKGVFITTSSFSSPAKEYAEELNGTTHLILIDGTQLAKYMYDYNVGFQVEQTIEIKKLDSEFWDSMENTHEN